MSFVEKKKIAIVGMAFRFPGGIDSSETFWQALQDGKDLVTEVDPERWDTSLFYHPDNDSPGKSYVFKAGQIENVADFDAQFFGISPREAEQMDPQQRLLMELSWSALQDAGQRVEKLRQSQTAVFIGVASSDYSNRRVEDLASADTYTMTGNTGSIASNRISYFYDFQGPSVSVDTACSSSLVAVHEACKSLWLGEATAALAGGVNMLLHPSPFVGFSKASMLSPTGSCKPFSSNGDGYVRSEGAGVLYLKFLDDAIRDGDRIHAVIADSAINSDGKTSGISMPSPEGQAKLLETLYSRAGFDINELDYVEAHGTGTAVGDPVEASSLGHQLGVRRSHNHVLPIGSIKGNLGHLETASGIAGLVKVIHSLKHRQVPPTVNSDGANPNIDFADLNLHVLLESLEFSDLDRPLRMGVNSFGFGGANAHVIVEEFVAKNYQGAFNKIKQSPSSFVNGTVPPFYLSAANADALQSLAAYYGRRIHRESADYYDLAWQSFNRQSRLREGVIFEGSSVDAIVEGLIGFSEGGDSNRESKSQCVTTGRRLAGSSPLVFAYSGNGSQWQGMGKALIENDQEFASYIDQVDELFSRSLTFSVKEEIMREDGRSNIRLTEYAQPMLFAIQYAMTRWLEKRGLIADYYLGHSVGEIAAAWAAGSLTLEDAVTVVCVRSASQALTRGTGRMAAVAVSADRAEEFLEKLGLLGDIEVACDNATSSVTLSGSMVKLSAVEQYCKNSSIRYKLLDLDYAFHSRYMEPIEAAIREDLRHIKPVRSKQFIPTTVNAKGVDLLLDAEYWWKNIRDRVLFREAIDRVIEKGVRLFVEIGPHPVIRSAVQEQLRVGHGGGLVLPAMSKTDPAIDLSSLLNKTFLAGYENQWSHRFPVSGNWIEVPGYPWQRNRYWREPTGDGYGLVDRRQVHPLLGWRVHPSLPIWESHLSEASPAYLADHVVGNSTVLPGSAYVELACAMMSDWKDVSNIEIRDMSIVTPLVLEKQADKVLRCTLSEDRGVFTISSRRRVDGDGWTEHCRGKITSGLPVHNTKNTEIAIASDGVDIPIDGFYSELAGQGLEYGDSFRVVRNARRVGGHRVVATLSLPSKQLAESHSLHPAILDGCFQLAALLVPERFNDLAYLPSQVDCLSLAGRGTDFKAQIDLLSINSRQMSVAVTLFDDDENILLQTEACRFKPMRLNQVAKHPKRFQWKAELSNHRTDRAVELFEDLRTFSIQLAEKIADPSLNSCGASGYMVESDKRFACYDDEFAPLLEAFLIGYADGLLRAISVDEVSVSLVDLNARGRVSTLEKNIFSWLLRFASDQGLVVAGEKTDEYQFIAGAHESPGLNEIWKLLAQYSAYPDEYLLFASFVCFISKIFDYDPGLAVDTFNGIEPSVNAETASNIARDQQHRQYIESLYTSGCAYAESRRLLDNAVSHLMAGKPQTKNISVLEINAAFTDSAKSIRKAISSEDVFHFITNSAIAYSAADTEFKECVNVDVEHVENFDGIDEKLIQLNDGESQIYDVIVLANTATATQNTAVLMQQVLRQLKPGGSLLVVGKRDNAIDNLMMGLTTSWWSESALGISVQQNEQETLSVLTASGCQVESVSHAGDSSADHYLLVAKKADVNSEGQGNEPLIATDTIVSDKHDLNRQNNESPELWLFYANESLKVQVVDFALRCKQQAGLGKPVIPLVVSYSDHLKLDGFDEFQDASLEYLSERVSMNKDEDVARSGVLNSALRFESAEHWQQLWKSLPALPARIIDLSSAQSDGEVERCHYLLALTHSLQGFAQSEWPTLEVVTRNAYDYSALQTRLLACDVDKPGAIAAAIVDPAERALWGFVRVMMNEYPGVKQKLIDIREHSSLEGMEALWTELIAPVEETEVILCDQLRYVCRWQEVDEANLKHSKRVIDEADDSVEKNKNKVLARLVVDEPGQLTNMQWCEDKQVQEDNLSGNDVVIENHNAGLNFRDVMFAMGLLPEEALENGFAGATLGMEFAGVVTAAGSEVEHVRVGDRVFGFAPNCFANQVVTQSSAVIRMPDEWSFAEAATVPTAFFTAYYSLKFLGQLQPGERVLIHGAAGAVGLAAIQIARHFGAEIYATAGSPQKRSYLMMLGVDAVFDSRSLEYAEQIDRITNGEGIDLVLNSLAGEAIERNLQVLKPFGRFIELGKRDFYADSSMGLKPFRNNVSYFGVDADQLLQVKPELVSSLLDEMMELFAKGVLQPLPYREFKGQNAHDAFRYMQHSRQLGKVVIDSQAIPSDIAGASKSIHPDWQADANACYLVTGGSKGLGWKLVEWLIEEKGARDIAVLSRSGFAEVEAEVKLTSWAERNIQVRHYPVDLSSEQVIEQLQAIREEKTTIKGIFHAAALIEDSLLTNTSHEQLDRVVWPKARGAWALHQFSLELELDSFVLFSSATTALGAPGQLAYVAANSYLEGLLDYRRQQSLPAACVSWGAVEDAGFVARNERAQENLLGRFGAGGLQMREVLAEVERALLSQHQSSVYSDDGIELSANYAYLNIEWRSVARHLPGASQRKYRLLANGARDSGVSSSVDVVAQIAAASEDQRHALTVGLLAKEVERILCLPSGELNIQQSLFEQGMDSLMGVELASAIQDQFETEISPMVLAEEPILSRVADRVLRELGLATGDDDTHSDRVDENTDEDVRRMESLVGRHVTGSESISQE